MILHDDWGAYCAMDWDSLPFTHSPASVVNHSKEIVNLWGMNTNRIDSVWLGRAETMALQQTWRQNPARLG